MPPEELWQAEKWFLELSAAGGERMKCVIRQPLKFQGAKILAISPLVAWAVFKFPGWKTSPAGGKHSNRYQWTLGGRGRVFLWHRGQ
jgi:hypothetical protein